MHVTKRGGGLAEGQRCTRRERALGHGVGGAERTESDGQHGWAEQGLQISDAKDH